VRSRLRPPRLLWPLPQWNALAARPMHRAAPSRLPGCAGPPPCADQPATDRCSPATMSGPALPTSTVHRVESPSRGERRAASAQILI
jgi:hypothetical protein